MIAVLFAVGLVCREGVVIVLRMKKQESRALKAKHETNGKADGKSVVGVFYLGTSTMLLASFAELQEVNERAIVSTPSRIAKT